MPFDDTPQEGHGPGDDGHDPEQLMEVARVSLVTLDMNCDANGVCNFHAGLVMQTMMIEGMIATVRAHSGDEDVMAMMSEQINTLIRGVTNLKEEQAKWQH